MSDLADDRLLIAQIQSGNEEAYERIFLTYYDGLVAYADKYISDTVMAEEIVQDLFVSFWHKRADIAIKSSLASYLYRAVRNACLNHIKHLKVRQEYQEHGKRERTAAEQNQSDSLIALELAEKIEQAIESLPEARRRIFIMNRYEGLKYREIAEKLDLSMKTVESQMSKALQFLREQLKEYMHLILLMGADFFNIF